jgi:hypothetical protein
LNNENHHKFDLTVGEGLMLMKVLFPFCGTFFTLPH